MEQVLQHVTASQTLTTSYVGAAEETATWRSDKADWVLVNGRIEVTDAGRWREAENQYRVAGLNSTGKGILIGMLSAFGSAALVALIFAIIYFFRYTSRGKIFLDRIGRPGEYDDEQQFLREEEEALAEMDDLQRTEYLRAKGMLVTGRIIRVH